MNKFNKVTILLLLGLIILQLLLLSFSSFTVWPEMILYPWLLNNGYDLYRDIINPYFPFMPLALGGFFKIFGASVFSLKLFTYLTIVASDLVIFNLSLKITKNVKKAFLSLIVFVLLHYSYGGNGLWFELFLAPFILASLGLIVIAPNKKRNVLTAGLLLSISVLIKQNAILFYLPVLFLLVFEGKVKQIIYLIIPGVITLLLLLIYIFSQGLSADFYLWAVKLTLSYTSQPGFISLPAIRQYPLILFPALVILGIVFSGVLNNKEKLFWISSILCSLLFAFPRYEDFHLQVLVAVSAVALAFCGKRFGIIFLIISVLLFSRSFNKTFLKPDRFLDQTTIELADKIKVYDSIYLLNAPELSYFLANKLPPKFWMTNFPWYFEQEGQEDRFIDNLHKEKTQTIVVGDRLGGGKYALGNYIPEKLLEYISSNYKAKERFQNYQIWQRK